MRQTRNKRSRLRKTMRGGFNNSKDIWSFGICKMIIDEIDRQPPAGVKKNWRAALTYLAERMNVTPELLYNRITPAEVLTRFGKGYLLKWSSWNSPATYKYRQFADNWLSIASDRNAALAEGKTWGNDYRLKELPLPGTEKSEEQKMAEKEAAEERAKLAWFQEHSEFAGQAWYEKRKQELEDGDSICCTEECEDRWGDSADPGLCLAARKGEAKRAEKSEARLKAAARKQALNANAQERWSNAQGPLLALAAQHGNNKGLRAALNGVPIEYNKRPKKGEVRPVYEQGTGMGITRGQYGYQTLLDRTNQWKAPPQQNGDFLNREAINEIMSRVFPEFAISGPSKTKNPEQRALYDQIVKGLKAVRYEKGYEDPDTHKPQLDVYDQAFSRASTWRKAGAVPADFLSQ